MRFKGLTSAKDVLNARTQPQGASQPQGATCGWVLAFSTSFADINPLKRSGVRWLHFELFSAIQV